MLWHIELKFYIWLCLTVLQIEFECRQFASIFVGVMPLSGLTGNTQLYTCIDKFSWNLKFHVGFFYVLEKYYTKIALWNVHDGRIMHRLRCSGIFLSMHLLLWMNVVHDFICMSFAELWGMNGEGAKTKKWKYMSPAGFELPTSCLNCSNAIQVP